MLASGIMDEDAGSMKHMIDCGAGAIVTKSIGIEPREGYPNPTVIELEHGILNAMGLPNPGIKNFKQEMQELSGSKVPIIGSIFGKNSSEFTFLAKEMESFGADAVELNLSCPHAKSYGLEIGHDPKIVQEITTKVVAQVTIPVFVKLSPNVMDIVRIAKAAEAGGAHAVVAINTIKAMKIDIITGKPILSNAIGGYSGKAIKPIGIRCVYEIAQEVQIPIIGVGGITSGEDIIEYLMAGAAAVQIGSGIYYRDVTIFKQICDEMKAWMKVHQYQNISELIGAAIQ